LCDGLDEISSRQVRVHIQESIKNFIMEQQYSFEEMNSFRRFLKVLKNFTLQHKHEKSTYYNRFLITSRVAGYDQMAFPNYPHYTIAELTTEQIEDFLPRWCRANIRRDISLATDGNNESEKEQIISKEAMQMASNLSSAIKGQEGVNELAENPLLLTLLAVMQQNSIVLPRQRVELYRVVVLTLLENRNIAKGLPVIPEAQAIQRLGPLAFEMQEEGNSFASRSAVLTTLKRTISLEGGTDKEIAEEVQNFLNRLRERAGIFVQRTGDYYGFFHRTFQEYFAARFMLNEIERNRTQGIIKLISRARRSDDLWRETFLLAVAYKSSEDSTVASLIIQYLLNNPIGVDYNQVHDLLLAAESVIEAKPLTIATVLEKQIAEQLLQIYGRACLRQQSQLCEQIEVVIYRWLLSLPREAYRPPLLTVISEYIIDTNHFERQLASLVLLTMIAGQLASCSPILFKLLIPPLLALTGLPAVGKHMPLTNLAAKPELIISDLALTVLVFMGKQGPVGLLLEEVRQYFGSHPESVTLLAHNSLESGFLLTPFITPRTSDNYHRYLIAMWKWLMLRRQHKTGHTTEQEICSFRIIHQELLECAEEVRYPSTIHMLNIYQTAEKNPDQDWHHIWQDYLLGQLASDQYIYYQSAALIWLHLFPEQQTTEQLMSLILEHFMNNQIKAHRIARHFIASIINTESQKNRLNALNLMKIRDIQELGYLLSLQDLQDLQDLQENTKIYYLDKIFNLQEREYIQDIQNLRDRPQMRHLQNILNIQDLLNNMEERIEIRELLTSGDRFSIFLNPSDKKYMDLRRFLFYMDYLYEIRGIRDLRARRDLRELRKLRNLHENQKMQELILTHEVAMKAITDLSSINQTDCLDFLSIIRERTFYILRADEIGQNVEIELQQAVQVLIDVFNSLSFDEVSDAILEIVSYLPARSVKEIKIILQLALETTDERIQQACALALGRSDPRTPEAWNVLESALQSNVADIHIVVEERLRLKK
jgi:hypothetical protein